MRNTIKIGRIYINNFFSGIFVLLIFLICFIDKAENIGGLMVKAVFLLVLILIAQTDYYSYQIPNYLVAILCLLTFCDIVIGGSAVGVGSRIAGIFPSALLLILAIWKPGAIGGGDIKLLAGAGGYLGIYGILYASTLASMLAGCVAGIDMIAGRADKHTKIAMGPYYTLGILFFLVFRTGIG